MFTAISLRFILIFLSLSVIVSMGSAQCPLPNAIVYESNEQFLPFDSIAKLCSPIYWFSPDEPQLYDQEGKIKLPQALPFEEDSNQPTVYYKIKEIYTPRRKKDFSLQNINLKNSEYLDLTQTIRFEIEYYNYYPTEQGAGSHPHDLEAVLFQIVVHKEEPCINSKYVLEIKRVIARAHGLYWFDNILNVDEATQFPMVILVEEGKHGNCTDKNGDGLYTPGYDVNEKPNDTWGVRDIISTGNLFTGGFQSWMAKVRIPESAIFPSGYTDSERKSTNSNRIQKRSSKNVYELKRFPKLPTTIKDRKLDKLVRGKKPIDWPRIHYNVKRSRITKNERSNVLRNKVGFSRGTNNTLELSVPLLLVRHVKAPMTGGWFYHKLYSGSLDTYPTAPDAVGVFGHQIRHSNSASRWLDTYVGMGYEVLTDRLNDQHLKTVLVSEVGIKVRVNITVTPFKFLRFLGTDYWGVSLGWRNRGYNTFESGSFVLSVGAGAF